MNWVPFFLSSFLRHRLLVPQTFHSELEKTFCATVPWLCSIAILCQNSSADIIASGHGVVLASLSLRKHDHWQSAAATVRERGVLRKRRKEGSKSSRCDSWRSVENRLGIRASMGNDGGGWDVIGARIFDDDGGERTDVRLPTGGGGGGDALRLLSAATVALYTIYAAHEQ